MHFNSKWKKRVKRLTKWLVIAFGSLILLACLLLGIAQTEAGKEQLARMIAAGLSAGPDAQVKIGKFKGIVPFNFRLSYLTVEDMNGRWMSIHDLSLHWLPSPLLKGCIHIEEISAARIGIYRLPPGRLPPKKREDMGSHFPKLIPPVVVETLAVERIILSEAVLGESATYRFDGRITSSDLWERADASFNLERIDGPETKVSVEVALKDKHGWLSLHVNVPEESGGLLASLLNIPDSGPLNVLLHGEGPITDWKGQLKASSMKFGTVDGEVGLRVKDNIKLSAHGKLEPKASLFPEVATELVGPENRFSLTASFDSNEIVLNRLTLTTDRATMNLTSMLDLEHESLDGKFEFKLDDVLIPRKGPGFSIGKPLVVSGTFSGPTKKPQVGLSVTLRDLQLAEFVAKKVQGEFKVDLLGPLTSSFLGLYIKGNGDIQEFALNGSSFLTEERLRWIVKAEMRENKVISIPKLELVGGKVKLVLSGEVDPTGPAGKADAGIKVWDLGVFSGFLGTPVSGSAWMGAKVRGNGENGSLSAHIDGRVSDLYETHPVVTALTGGDINCSATVELTEAKKLTVSRVYLDTVGARLWADASINFLDKGILGRWELELPNLSALSPLFKRDLNGSARLDGKIRGTLGVPKVTARAKTRHLSVEGKHFPDMGVELSLEDLRTRPTGHIQLKLQDEKQSIIGASSLDIEGQHLKLSSLCLDGPGIKINGNLGLYFDNILAHGHLHGASKDLSLLSPFLGQKIAGSAQFKVQVDASSDGQELYLECRGKDLFTAAGGAKELSLSAHIRDALNTPHGRAKVDIKDFRKGGLEVDELGFRVSGSTEHVAFSAGATGRYQESFEVKSAGMFTTSSNRKEVEINYLQGRYGKYPVALSCPLTLQQIPDGYAMDDLLLKVGAGHLKGSGRVGEDSISVAADFTALPLGAMRQPALPWFNGQTSGQIQLTGQSDNPKMHIEVVVSQLGVEGSSNGLSIDLSGRGKLEGGRFDLDLTMDGLGKKPIKAEMAVPIVLSFSPLALSLPSQGELNMNLTGEAELAAISPFLPIDAPQLAGRLAVALRIGGSLDMPKLNGSCSIINGYYENLQWGTVLEDIDVEAIVKQDRIYFKDIHATDGEKGVISSKGWLDVLPAGDFPFQMGFCIEEATLVRNNILKAVFSGDLDFSGTLKEAALTGDISLVPADVHISEDLPPEIAELEVIEINRAGQEVVSPPEPQPPLTRKLSLNLGVDLPHRVFIRGRGLDSEWKGKLSITGYASAPVIRGTLGVVRGHFNFFGRRFSLARGSIVFDGSVPPRPMIDVTAETDADEVHIFLRFSGSFSSPEITLGSEPFMPDDEILAHLLFGRSLGQITPIQGLQLVRAVNTLRGGGSGLDIVGHIRSLTSVDLLEFKSDEEGTEGELVSIGKYINEDTFVQVEQGLGPESGEVSVEVELTPNITVKTKAGADANGGAEIKWKWDY